MRVFYDLTCPFCYLAQPFNQKLVALGVKVTELPFQAHPEIPINGVHMGPRRGPMYDDIAKRAQMLHLPLNWTDKLPNSRLALTVAEWTRQVVPDKADEVREKLFHAHFAEGKDIGNKEIILNVVADCDIDREVAESALKDGSGLRMILEAETLARSLGVRSTPSWESQGSVVSGLNEATVMRLAKSDD